MPLHILLSTWLGSSLGVLQAAKVAKDVLMVLGFVFVLLPSINQPWFKQLLKDKLTILILAYAALNVIMAVLKPTDQGAEVLGVVYNTRFLLFFVYGTLLTFYYKKDYLIKRSLQVVLGAAFFVVLFGLMQYVVLPNDALTHLGYSKQNGVLPAFFIDNKPDLERIMSTLRDPNSLGSYLIIVLTLAMACFMRTKNMLHKRLLAGLLVGTVFCLLFTYSRSALIGAMMAATVFVALNKLKAPKLSPGYYKLIAVTTGVVLVVTASLLISYKNSYFVQNVLFHADKSTTLEDPNQLRARFFKESVNQIAKHPEGMGPGTAGLASIKNQKQGVILNENYYLQIGSELGVVGLVLFVAILAVVATRLYVSKYDPLAVALLASFAGLLITNFLVHIWSNEAVAYTWWGLAALIVAINYRKTDNIKQAKS